MQAAGNIIELRRLLAERFPHASPAQARIGSDRACPTGVAALDRLLGGGISKGELTELVAPGHGSGSAQVLHALLRQAAADGKYLALVDGADSFDVDAAEPEALARLLWIRCRTANEALKAADMVLRDRNFPLVALDLKLNSASELRRIPSSVWFRYKRLLDQNPAAFLVVTPQTLVGGPACRVGVNNDLHIKTLAQTPAAVLSQLRFRLLRTTRSGDAEIADQVIRTGAIHHGPRTTDY